MKIGPHNIYEDQFSWKNHKIGLHISCFPPVFLAIRQIKPMMTISPPNNRETHLYSLATKNGLTLDGQPLSF